MIPDSLRNINFDGLTPEQKAELKQKLQQHKQRLEEAMRQIEDSLRRCG